MSGSENPPAGLFHSFGRLAGTGLALLHNRAELLALELQEERLRFTEILLWLAVLLFFGIVCALVLTATIILLFAPEARIYVAGAFSILYLVGTVWAFGSLKSRMAASMPLAQTVSETQKDREVIIGELTRTT